MVGVTRATAGPMVKMKGKVSVQGRAGLDRSVQNQRSGACAWSGQVEVDSRSPAVPGCFEQGLNVTSF